MSLAIHVTHHVKITEGAMQYFVNIYFLVNIRRGANVVLCIVFSIGKHRNCVVGFFLFVS